jgi:MRG-binding protein
MIALSEHLRNHGYDPQVDQHTRIPGIWKKLRTLYNLDIIDDRENSFEYEEDSEDKYKEFKIPNDLNMEHEMFMRGKRPEAQTPSEVGSSPPRLFERSPSPRENRKRKRDLATKGEGTGSIADTDEVPTSPVAASSPAAKTTRSGRSTNRRARVEQESAVESKNTTADEDEGDDEEEVAEESQEEASDEEAEAPSQTKGASRSKPGPPARTATATRRGKRKR